MWEEHPAYQKGQAVAIGVGLILLLVAAIVHCVSEHDWRLLKQVLLFAGAFVFCVAVLSLTARFLVRIFGQRRNDNRES